MFNWFRKSAPALQKQEAPATTMDAASASDRYKLQGNTLFGHGRLDEAATCFLQAISLYPDNAAAHFNLGLVRREQGRLDDAVGAFTRAGPAMADALHLIGAIRQQQGQLEEAISHYRRAIAGDPAMDRVYGDLCLALFQSGSTEEALQVIQAGIARHPGISDFHLFQGNLLVHCARHAEGAACYRRAIALEPGQAQVHNNLGIALQALGDFDAALQSAEHALRLDANYADAHRQRGAVLGHLYRHEEALQAHDQAIALDAGHAGAHANRAITLGALQRYDAALAACARSLQLDDSNPEVHNNHGLLLGALGRHDQALVQFDHALRLDPHCANALCNRAMTLGQLQRREEQLQALERLQEVAPDYPYGIGFLLGAKAYLCDWAGRDPLIARVENGLRTGRRTVVPFTWLALSDSAELQWRCSRIYAADKFPPARQAVWQGERYRHDKIRIAYLSADLHQHATAYLMAELFERHDHQRFETTALSFGPDTPSAMRSRLQQAFTRFMDVRDKSDLEIAQLVRALEIDIAVDLKGYTTDARMGIFRHHPAPVQVAYVGYPGTLGTGTMDYLIADARIIAPDVERWYSEKIVRLPDSYQPNDAHRSVAPDTPPRLQHGLPEHGFVFCCFNNNYKITPEVFGIWMRLLHQVPGSVLWLLEDHAVAARNLRREATERGVASERLVFAPRMEQAAHLARHRLADLFLDTLPCNAHTTASDALWCGLPVLTCTGEAFSARVAASLLDALGLPELVTTDLVQYEARALELSTSRSTLAQVRASLENNRAHSPLFDADRLCRHLEAAYTTMWERQQAGAAPEGFAVAPLP